MLRLCALVKMESPDFFCHLIFPAFQFEHAQSAIGESPEGVRPSLRSHTGWNFLDMPQNDRHVFCLGTVLLLRRFSCDNTVDHRGCAPGQHMCDVFLHIVHATLASLTGVIRAAMNRCSSSCRICVPPRKGRCVSALRRGAAYILRLIVSALKYQASSGNSFRRVPKSLVLMRIDLPNSKMCAVLGS